MYKHKEPCSAFNSYSCNCGWCHDCGWSKDSHAEPAQPPQRTCPTCGSKGFDVSIIGPEACSFCDGTEAGQGPAQPQERFIGVDLASGTDRSVYHDAQGREVDAVEEQPQEPAPQDISDEGTVPDVLSCADHNPDPVEVQGVVDKSEGVHPHAFAVTDPPPLPQGERFAFYIDDEGDYIVEAIDRKQRGQFLVSDATTIEDAVWRMRETLAMADSLQPQEPKAEMQGVVELPELAKTKRLYGVPCITDVHDHLKQREQELREALATIRQKDEALIELSGEFWEYQKIMLAKVSELEAEQRITRRKREILEGK